MADDFVQLVPDGTGKKIDNASFNIGGNFVYRQRMVLGSNTNTSSFAAILPTGRLQTSDEPTQLFYDPFDGGLIDTSIRWNTASGGGGVAPSIATSVLVMGTGTTANGYSSLTSQATFGYTSPSWLGTSAAIKIENPVIANTYRFFGFGSSPTTPTAAAPLTDAVGFEVATDGKMYAVMYNAGVRTVIQDMSANSTQPVDGNYHRWIIYCRIDRIYWYIDTTEVPVATSTFNIPNSQVLPIKSLAIAGATAPTTSAVLTNGGWSVWDTGRNNVQISDGVYPQRKLTIKPLKELASTTDNALVASIAASSVLTTARPDGFLRTQIDPTTLLFDTFESINTTDTWTVSGTVLPTGTSGVLSVAPGATINATSYAVSKPAFTPGSNAYLVFAAIVQIEAGVITNSSRWFGLGTVTTPTQSIPIQNGTIFEIGTDGNLYGRIYSAGVQTQSIALTRPTDGAYHRYVITYKASRVYFEIDNVNVASLAFPNPSVSALPTVIGSINGATAPSAAPLLNSSLMGVADSARLATKNADGLFPWRMQTVKAPNTAVVAADLPAVVALHPSSPLPAGSNIIGIAGVQSAAQPSSTGSLTATALATVTGTTNTTGTVVASVATAGNATVTFKGTVSGTYAFEISDDNGTTWYPTMAVRSSDNFASITTGVITTAQAWDISCPGITYLRVRCTAFTTAATVSIMPGGFLYAPDVTVLGDVPSGTADANNPQKIGGQARITNPAVVADAARVNAIFDKLGKQIVVGAIRELKGSTTTALTLTSDAIIAAAPAAGVFRDVYGLTLANTGTSPATVTIKSNAVVMTVIVVPASATAGFMLPVDSALKANAVATTWTAALTVAGTVTATVLWVDNL